MSFLARNCVVLKRGALNMKRLLFIYNPRAGKELLKPKLSDVIDIFVKAGYEVTVYPTQKHRDAYEKVVSYDSKNYDLIVCSGGDGTIDEVVTGMMERDEKDPIGYIPTGTINDFANSLFIPKKILEAADVAVNGKAFKCDVGRMNDGTFVYVAAFGLFTDVSYGTDQSKKNILGHLAYVLEGVKSLLKIPTYKMKVTYDGNVIEDEFVIGMVTNSRSVGGVRNMIGDRVVFDDGMFEVTLIKMPKNPLELSDILAAFLLEQIDAKHIYTFSASKVTFECEEEIPWTLDGEFGGNHKVVVVENLQKQLEIMVPAEHIEELKEFPFVLGTEVSGEKEE